MQSNLELVRPVVTIIEGVPYNSNTFSYNMIDGVGITPPPMPFLPGYKKAAGAWN